MLLPPVVTLGRKRTHLRFMEWVLVHNSRAKLAIALAPPSTTKRAAPEPQEKSRGQCAEAANTPPRTYATTASLLVTTTPTSPKRAHWPAALTESSRYAADHEKNTACNTQVLHSLHSKCSLQSISTVPLTTLRIFATQTL